MRDLCNADGIDGFQKDGQGPWAHAYGDKVYGLLVPRLREYGDDLSELQTLINERLSLQI